MVKPNFKVFIQLYYQKGCDLSAKIRVYEKEDGKKQYVLLINSYIKIPAAKDLLTSKKDLILNIGVYKTKKYAILIKVNSCLYLQSRWEC